MAITNDKWYIDQADAQRKRVDGYENAFILELDRLYARTNNKVIKEIKGFYSEYDNPTYSQARQYLPSDEAQEVQEDALRQASNIVRGDASIKKDLEQLGKKDRLNRLDALTIGILIILGKHGNKQNISTDDVYTKVIKNQHLRTLWTVGRGQGFSLPVKPLSNSRIASILRKPLNGANYSTKLWADTNRLAGLVNQTIREGLISGAGTDKIARTLAPQIENQLLNYNQTTLNRTRTIVRTDMTRIATEADMLAYEDAGIDEYVFVATLDDRTTDVCASLDGEIEKLDNMQPWVNAPPMNYNCRSTTLPNIGTPKQRRARDAEGNSIVVSGDTTYSDWKKEVYNE